MQLEQYGLSTPVQLTVAVKVAAVSKVRLTFTRLAIFDRR